MSSDIVELTRLRLENARLTNQLETNQMGSERDAETIRTLKREVNSLNLLIENDRSKDLKLRRLARENDEMRDNLSDKSAKIQYEMSKRNRMENNLSEIEDDNDWLRKIESKQRKEKLLLKSLLSETKSDLRRMSRSQENLQSRLSEDRVEYGRADREFQKLEDSWTKRNKRRRSSYGRLYSPDTDVSLYSSPNYRHYRHYLY